MIRGAHTDQIQDYRMAARIHEEVRVLHRDANMRIRNCGECMRVIYSTVKSLTPQSLLHATRGGAVWMIGEEKRESPAALACLTSRGKLCVTIKGTTQHLAALRRVGSQRFGGGWPVP